MNVLVAFGTTEGQTKKIARHIETTLQSAGHVCTTLDCEGSDRAPDLASYDAVIVAGSVHEKRHQRAVAAFALAQRDALQDMPAAFISVSLSIINPDGKAEAREYVDGFIAETGWTPTATHLAAGAIRFLEYDFFKEFTVKNLVLGGQKLPDKAAGNPEYTDWAQLEAFVESFLDGIAAKAA